MSSTLRSVQLDLPTGRDTPRRDFVRERTESQGLDLAMQRLRENRRALLDVARRTAVALCGEHGEVTSPFVVRTMRDRGYGPMLDQVDRRFLGALFSGPQWVRSGMVREGSHRAPVTVWRLACAETDTK